MLGAPRAVGIGKLPSLSIVLDSMVRHFYQLKMLDAKPQGGFRESRVAPAAASWLGMLPNLTPYLSTFLEKADFEAMV